MVRHDQMGKARIQIAGMVRFSYPALSGFRREADSAGLMDPARLERRFHLFERLTLPSLLAQEDTDFALLVLIGEALPTPFRDRLADLLAPLTRTRIVALPPMHHYPATQAAFAQLPTDGATHLTSFRLDDDDALDKGHIARLRRQVEGLSAFVTPDRPFAVGANHGFFLHLSPDGNRLLDVTEKMPIGIGLSLTAPVDSGLNIFRRNHRLLPQFFTTFTDADTPAFIRSIHADNDSDAHASGQVGQMTEAQVAAAVEAHFPFSARDLLAL